ncbi:MAG: hypothetical protein DHS20C20_00570 [Ardenticatenaceae bacterium]|nr:MAG: hypothetical protein DHS20C20_00570 [Ardenticatenaceae bacterium]
MVDAAKKMPLIGRLKRIDQINAGLEPPSMRILGVAKLLNKNNAERAMKPIVRKIERALAFLPSALFANSAAMRAMKLANAPK